MYIYIYIDSFLESDILTCSSGVNGTASSCTSLEAVSPMTWLVGCPYHLQKMGPKDFCNWPDIWTERAFVEAVVFRDLRRPAQNIKPSERSKSNCCSVVLVRQYGFPITRLRGNMRKPHCIGKVWIAEGRWRKFRSQTSDNMDRWKSRGGKNQRGREEERKSEKRKSQRKKMQVREKVEQSQFTVFIPMICDSRGSKSRFVKAEGAGPSGQKEMKKLHAVVARGTCGSWECRKSVRSCGEKHVPKSKSTKHLTVGAILEVDISKKCTPLGVKHISKSECIENILGPLLKIQTRFCVAGARDSASCQSLKKKTWDFWSRFKYNHHYTTNTNTNTTKLHYITLRYYTTLHYTTLIRLHYTALHSTPLHPTTLHELQLQWQLHFQLQLRLHYAGCKKLRYTPLHHTILHYATLHQTTLQLQLQLQLQLRLHYTTLITLHYATLHYPQSNYTTLHSIKLHKLQVQLQLQLKNNYNYTTLHYTILHYTTTLHYTEYITLHYTAYNYKYNHNNTRLPYNTIQYNTIHYTH